jgi:transposase
MSLMARKMKAADLQLDFLGFPLRVSAMFLTTPLPRTRILDRTRCSTASLDQLLPADHPVRTLWAFVQHFDWSPWYARIRAVEGGPGAPAIAPEVLFALWLFATTEGISSSRQLAERCHRDLPYQWLCGAEPVNYWTLNDFYHAHAADLDHLFVEHIAALRSQGLIRLQTVTVDGRKVVASASKDTFHREATLEQHLAEAEQHVATVSRQRAASGLGRREQAARERAAVERVQRLQRAVSEVRRRQEQRRQSKRADAKPEAARASESDPDAARMKMPNGGYALAFNVQTVTDTEHGLIVTVTATNQGSDNGYLQPLREQVQQEQGTCPAAVLVDSGYSDAGDVQTLETGGVVVYMPPRDERKDQKAGRDPYAPKRRDTPVLQAWRARMGTAAARQAYRQRAPVAEGVHAQAANRGWRRCRLRGVAQVTREARWQALAHNWRRLQALGAVTTEGTVRDVAR